MGTPFLQEPGCGALVEIHPCFSGGYGGLHTLDSDRWLWHTAPCFPVDDAYGHFYSWGSLLFTGKIAPPAILELRRLWGGACSASAPIACVCLGKERAFAHPLLSQALAGVLPPRAWVGHVGAGNPRPRVERVG